MLDVKANDLAALQALRDAMYACNAADAYHLQFQCGGTYGLVHNTFMDAASQLIGADNAKQLMYYLIDSGEDVTYCLDLVRSELCGVCAQRIDDTDHHCSECGTCTSYPHNADCSELICQGHPTTDGPMGVSAYCDGTCRKPLYLGVTY